MRKIKFFITSVILASALTLSACHGSVAKNEFTVPESFDESVEHEITFWAKNDTNMAQTMIYKKAIADFEKIYPNIKVNLRLYTDYSKIYNDVITNISTNTPPNVCITYPDHIATYMSGSNVIVPLDTLLDDPSYGLGGSNVKFDAPTRDEIIPKFLEECSFNDHCYCLPFMRSTEALYINEDLVKKLGYDIPDIVTWDYVWELSEKAMEQDADGTFKINSQKVMIPFIYKSTDNMMISYLKQTNAPYSDASGNIGIFNDTTRGFLKEIASHAKTGAFSTFKISSYPGNFLNAGQCIFAIDSTAGATWMGADAPLSDISDENKVDFNTVVRIIPQADPSNPKMISQGPSVCIFNKEDPQEVLASWLFTQYLLTNEVQMAYSETEGYVPVTLKAQNDPAYIEYLNESGKDKDHYHVKIEAARLLLDNTDNTFVTEVFNGSASLRDAAGALIENVTKAERRKKTVDDAFLDKTFSDVTNLYHLNETSGGASSKQALGPLPGTARTLLTLLGLAWVLIILYVVYEFVQKKKDKH